jgi:hypothetical protein
MPVRLLLAEGMFRQFGPLTSTAIGYRVAVPTVNLAQRFER